MELVRLADDLQVWLDDRSEGEFLYREIFEQRAYLPDRIHLDEKSVVFDIGANIGLASIFFAKICNVAAVYAFEPVHASYALLQSNFETHRIKGVALPFALSETSGRAVLTHYPRASAKSGFYPDPVADQLISRRFLEQEGMSGEDIEWILRRKYGTELVVVECRTLSDVIDFFGVPYVDLLKLDVEKSELDVLLGVTDEQWAAGRIRQVVAEVHGDRLCPMGELLRRHGFQVDVTPAGDGGTRFIVARLV
jgi:31-O-methyltransferase